ncbi:MAG TPA: hypothetical protein PLZ53_11875, partial [Candidatus Hydrogenedentes bacterium]|nr:hypothetical protein [Candidatus Hydrogenedentota bacterium]
LLPGKKKNNHSFENLDTVKLKSHARQRASLSAPLLFLYFILLFSGESWYKLTNGSPFQVMASGRASSSYTPI